MRRNLSVRAWLAIVIAGVTLSPALFAQQDTGRPAAWTKAEALEQLRLAPHDPFLQFVVIQMCLRDGDFAEAGLYLPPALNRRDIGAQRNRQIDLYRIFSGSLAVQETLQLDALAGPLNAMADVNAPPRTAGPGIVIGREPGDVHQTQREPNLVPASQLQGPTVQSHPWAKMLGDKMLGDKDPPVSALAMCVPSDQLYIRFDSIGDLHRARQRVDQLANYLSNKVGGQGFNSQAIDRLETQLWLETHEFLKPIYDVAVSEVAITSSDLFFREGTDTTVILRLKQAHVARQTLDQFLGLAKQRRSDVTLVEGSYAGVGFKHLSTPDRTIHCYSANPTPELHVRSNSRVAFERVLDTILERGHESAKIERLGDTDEFRYIRTLYPLGDDQEQGFIYLSDPFIRRLIGPEKKLTQRNRMICRSRLQLLGYASLLQRTQTGQPPSTIDDSLQSGWLGTDKHPVTIACPDGGTYALTDSGLLATCSHHGHPESMIPCCEVPVESVGQGEAAEYRQFVENYSQYWSTFFDPIAIRIQLEPQRTRIETIILPLINNTIYQGLASMLGGDPEPLDSLPVPERNIFSVAVKLNKPLLLEQAGFDTSHLSGDADQESVQELELGDFLIHGIGNQIGFHVCDSDPPIDFSVSRMLGLMASVSQNRSGFSQELGLIAVLASSLNAPVYLSIPVQDAEVVDRFLSRLDDLLVRLINQPDLRRGFPAGFLNIEHDVYGVGDESTREFRAYSLQFGPLTWRFYWERIGNGLFIASKPYLIQELSRASQATSDGNELDESPAGHGMVRIRPQHWNRILPHLQIGWSEAQRRSCLHNVSFLSSAARGLTSASGRPVVDADMLKIKQLTRTLFQVEPHCGAEGKYTVTDEGTGVCCTAHGCRKLPRQANGQQTELAAFAESLTDVQLQMTFTEDGLHTIVTFDND